MAAFFRKVLSREEIILNINLLYRAVLILLIAWYVSVCAVHYLSLRSLWNDELAVFDSIRFLNPSELFLRPLLTDQAFPHFYLFMIQFLAKPFGNYSLSLRFFPFVCMLTAFGVWLSIARRELKNSSEYLTFILCWTASVPLIYYSAELKQYSMDVLVSGLFVWFLYEQDKLRLGGGRKYVGTLALLPLSVLFSYPAYFFLFFPLWNLCLELKSDKAQWKYILVYLSSVFICVALSYQFDIRLRPMESVANGFNDYFIAMSSFKDFLQTFGEGVNNLFSRWFVELPKVFRKLARFFMFFGLIYMFVGFFKNIHKSKWKFYSISTVALVVFFELAVAGASQKYPFGVPRTALFLCPMLLILTVQGIRQLKTLNPYVYYAVHGSFVVYLCVVAIGILRIVLTQPLIAIPTIWSL